jgi:hypothetical protein
MKKPANKKLSLACEKLRTLDALALVHAVGGVNQTSNTAYGQTCTCHD